MRKYLRISFYYAIAAMVGGVFYREFTKWNGFTGVTALGKVHVHLFLLGMMMFLFVALFSEHHDLEGEQNFGLFLKLYNIGVPLTAVMLVVRGIVQVKAIPVSSGLDASISGIAGIAHILTGTGLVLLFLALMQMKDKK
jgi:hypothetical protein